ncbi:MAG: hypothetical protein QM781_08350 [Chitinophagaceae bacterium]
MKPILSLLAVLLLSSSGVQAQPCTIPNALFADDTIVVCQGTSYQLTVPSITGATYVWSTTEANQSIQVQVNGRYWVEVTDGACSVSDTVTVLFNSFLLSPSVSDIKLCKGRAAAPLQVAGQQVRWYSDPIGGTGNTTMPVPSTADTGRMTYWVTQTIRGCESPRVPLLVRVIE